MNSPDFLTVPHVPDNVYSPIHEGFYPNAFGKFYVADSYTTSPDHLLPSNFDFDSSCYKEISPVEALVSEAIISEGPKIFNAQLLTSPAVTAPPDTTYGSPVNISDPFGQLEPFPFGLCFSTSNESYDTSASSHLQSSQMPSACDDRLQQYQSVDSAKSLSPRTSRQGTTVCQTQKKTNPTLKRNYSSTSHTSIESPRRVPHNQVERKYRKGLNAELERLRRTVPTLPQGGDGGDIGQSKPSKAMVLAAAIMYIKNVEQERDAYRAEIERYNAKL